MTFRTHITIADRGWILEKLAKEIADRSDLVTYSTETDASADLQYYINYSCRRRRVGKTEIAFFTHSENDEGARKRYFDIAKDVEHVVCMSKRYADELIEAGISNITTITPGVDLDKFQPKIRVGVIGRTYHTGRKGESLVADVMDLPGIDWRFTGQGWPGESTFVPDSGMPDFYNDLDYVLIPALYEGGPMSVLEGLACGVPIIASDVGWVNEYPHIPFETGDSASLRKVLEGLITERQKLRSTVEHRTWSAWGEQHLEMFENVAKKHGIIRVRAASSAPKPKQTEKKIPLSAFLMSHGGEGKTLGGPSVRVPKTAGKLAELGVATQLPEEDNRNFSPADIVHVFNTWPADSAFSILEKAKQAGKTTVFSPIYLNLTHSDAFSRQIPALYASNPNGETAFRIGLKSIHSEAIARNEGRLEEPYPGYHERVRACIAKSDHVILLSQYERDCLNKIDAEPEDYSLVENPVDVEKFSAATGDMFRNQFSADEYILCVGRIEPRKNQLLLAIAARELDLPLVLIGHDGNKNYANLVRQAAGPKTKFISRIDPSDPLLPSAFAGSRVFCLPSWSEGAPLAALEAGASGTSLVLSSMSSEPEYFEGHARFVHPADLEGMKVALQEAWDEKRTKPKRQRQITHVRKNYSWETYARKTADAYESATHKKLNSIDTASPIPSSDRIYFDLTTTWHHNGQPTGIARVEDNCYKSLLELLENRVQPIVWNSKTDNFLMISIADSLSVSSLEWLVEAEKSGRAQVIDPDSLERGARLLNFGGAWIRNSRYVNAIRSLKTQSDLNLSAFIFDLIQLKFKQYYPTDSWIDFSNNIKSLADISDDFIVSSEASRNDLLEFLKSEGQAFKAISNMRFGDMTAENGPGHEEAIQKSEMIKGLREKEFVIFVSSLDLRKNHALLINVWRRLIEQRGDKVPELLFIGRNMWRGEEIVHQIENDTGVRNRIRILDNVDDSELTWLYQNALFTAYPSFYEGWGLPVAESLSFGTPCIASSSSSIKEINPELTDLLDPYDFTAWVDKIGRYLDDRVSLQRRREEISTSFENVTWGSAVEATLAEIEALPLKTTAAPITWSSMVVDFTSKNSDSILIGHMCGSDWGRMESAGRWGLKKQNRLSLRVSRPPNGKSITIRIIMGAFQRPSHSERLIEFAIAGRYIGKYAIRRDATLIDLEIDPKTLNWDSENLTEFEIRMDMDDVFGPSDFSSSEDKRKLGPLIQKLAIGHSTDQLELLLPANKYMLALTSEEYETDKAAREQALSSKATSGALQLTREEKEILQTAAARLETPRTLPERNLIFRALKATRADRVLLSIHRRLFARTNDSLSRIITVLSNAGKKP